MKRIYDPIQDRVTDIQREDLMLADRSFIKIRNKIIPKTYPVTHQITLGLDLRRVLQNPESSSVEPRIQ